MPEYLSKNQIAKYRKLTQRKHRDRYRLFIIEGLRAVEQVVSRARVEIDAILVTRDGEYPERIQNIECFRVEPEIYAELSDTQNPQGIMAVCRMIEPCDLNSLFSIPSGVIVATDGIQDPGNLGTIIRSSTWFKSAAIILGEGTVDYYNPKVVRSTAGAVGVVPHVNASLNEVLPQFQDHGWDVVLLDASGDAASLKSMKINEKTVIVVGNEAGGISSGLMSSGYRKIFIDGESGNVESLNASVALSISLFFFHDQ